MINTKLSVDEVGDRLSAYVARPTKWYQFRWFSWDSEHNKAYEGEITDNTFSLSSIEDYFLIKGVITPGEKGSVVTIKIDPEPFFRPTYLRRRITFAYGFEKTPFTFALGMGALYVLSLGGLIIFFNPQPSIVIAVAAALSLPIGYGVWIYVRAYEKRMRERIHQRQQFFMKLFTET